jgi:hypothetical protein
MKPYKAVGRGKNRTFIVQIPCVFTRGDVQSKHWPRTRSGMRRHLGYVFDDIVNRAESEAKSR